MWVPPRVAGRRAPRNKFLRVHSFRRMPRNFPRLRNIWFQPEMSFRDIFSLLVQYYLCSSHTYSWKFEEFFCNFSSTLLEIKAAKEITLRKKIRVFSSRHAAVFLTRAFSYSVRKREYRTAGNNRLMHWQLTSLPRNRFW